MCYLTVEKHHSHFDRKVTLKSKEHIRPVVFSQRKKKRCGVSLSSASLKVTSWKTSFCWLHRFSDRKQQSQWNHLYNREKTDLNQLVSGFCLQLKGGEFWDWMALRLLVLSTLVLLDISVDKFNLVSVRANACCLFRIASTKELGNVLVRCWLSLEKRDKYIFKLFCWFGAVFVIFYIQLLHILLLHLSLWATQKKR